MSALDRLIAAGFQVPGDVMPESRYFEPTDRCPHPEWWHATDGDSSELQIGKLLAGLVSILQPELVVETGAAFGITSRVIGLALAVNSHGMLHAIEHDELRAEVAMDRVAEFPVDIYLGSSLEYRPPREIDLLFSDSDMETRVPEFLYLREWLPVGAIVVFHDARPGTALRSDIDRALVGGGYLSLIDLPTPRGCVLCQVLDPETLPPHLQRQQEDDAELRRTVPR
jgi:hypothetical protein